MDSVSVGREQFEGVPLGRLTDAEQHVGAVRRVDENPCGPQARDRFRTAASSAGERASLFASQAASIAAQDPLARSLAKTSQFLLNSQHTDGYWVAELEGDSILESEFILLQAYLGRHDEPVAQKAARYLLDQQMACGGWSNYPGGPVDVSASIKAYLALKVTGHGACTSALLRARRAIGDAGGLGAANSFTRFYLAMLGQIPYSACPAVPPEMMLLPRYVPLNLYEMSAWTRTIVVPLSILYAYQPVRRLPRGQGIEELWGEEGPPDRSPAPGGAPGRWLTWDRLFYLGSELAKQLDGWGIRPLRRRAIRAAERWMVQRFEKSDGLGAIFPPIVWSVIALRCLGYRDDHPWVAGALEELHRLVIEERDRVRLQPCVSPVWDTALSMLALSEAGATVDTPAIQRGAQWLISKQVASKGDWSVHRPSLPPGGWYFEFRNEFYPDLDDTAMVLMALARSRPGDASVVVLPGESAYPGRQQADGATDRAALQATTLMRRFDWWRRQGFDAAKGFAAHWQGKTSGARDALHRIEPVVQWTAAVDRGLRWVLGLQNRDGGWAAFDVDNDRELLTRVPFADHNAMLDPSTSDITGRVLEMLGMFGYRQGHPAVDRGVAFVLRDQCKDGSWYGRWGVNYLYGTWQSLVGLRSVGVGSDHPSIRRAVRWLLCCQQSSGGWGESCRSYDDPAWKGRGAVTASQTSWALMGLMAAGGWVACNESTAAGSAVRRGVEYLLSTQLPDGTWDEPYFTGTGFPRVFYLKYHFYRVYFPLLALARYACLSERAS